MITVQITCDTGNTWATGFNGTLAEARDYFVDQKFTRELDDGAEITDTCTNIAIANND